MSVADVPCVDERKWVSCSRADVSADGVLAPLKIESADGMSYSEGTHPFFFAKLKGSPLVFRVGSLPTF